MMVDWAHRRAGVQGDDQDPGEVERHLGELRVCSAGLILAPADLYG